MLGLICQDSRKLLSLTKPIHKVNENKTNHNSYANLISEFSGQTSHGAKKKKKFKIAPIDG